MGLFSSQIAAKKMVPLCRQFATSYDAGIPVLRSLEIIAGQQRDARIRGVLHGMRDDLRQGATLGEAARRQSKYVPRVFVELLTAGELGGKLDVMLRDLADYYESRLEMQRRIRRMMTMPVLQLVAAWFLGSFALGLVSRLGALFNDRSGVQGGISFIEAYFRDYLRFQAVACLLALGAFLAMVAVSRTGVVGRLWGWLKLKLWPFSGAARRFALARFFRTLSLMVSAGVHLPRAIESAAAAASNAHIERDLLQAVTPVENGATLVEAFSRSRYLTPTAREMILVGEESGELDKSLHKVAQYHFEEAEQSVNIITKISGVMIVLLVALLIGYIVIKFYMMYFGGMMNMLNI